MNLGYVQSHVKQRLVPQVPPGGRLAPGDEALGLERPVENREQLGHVRLGTKKKPPLGCLDEHAARGGNPRDNLLGFVPYAGPPARRYMVDEPTDVVTMGQRRGEVSGPERGSRRFEIEVDLAIEGGLKLVVDPGDEGCQVGVARCTGNQVQPVPEPER